MKLSKFISIIFIVGALLTFLSGCGKFQEEKSVMIDQSQDEITNQDAENKNALGNYEVEIKAVRVTSDDNGHPVIIVRYLFKNNDKLPRTFWDTINDEVMQNGTVLTECYSVKTGDPYKKDNQTKEITHSASTEVDVAYMLVDTVSDVEVTVSEYFNSDNKVISKTFEIAA